MIQGGGGAAAANLALFFDSDALGEDMDSLLDELESLWLRG